eukprot:TRINITY_DN5405_c0_g1_i1.p1 TRINITY_DN5405_c0_g1~~TRINITY_DN5405_c0_g1_i1.p1  ORF type:complete len:193 (+),score=60.40 TRINITY_DN5405_c0_g1_i1:2547-3125(+)
MELLRQEAHKDAMEIILQFMPSKLAELDRLYLKYNNKADTTSSEGLHSTVMELLSVLRSEISILLEYIETIKLWIKLNIPKVEGGNNFGVSIQEEIIGVLEGGTRSGRSYLGSMTKYYVRRAELMREIEKYPGVEDFQLSLTDMDEKEYALLAHCCMNTRNDYAVLIDVLTKNMKRLENPKNTTSSFQDFMQ